MKGYIPEELKKKHSVIVVYRIKEPYSVGTIAAYDAEGFIEMSKGEEIYPVVKAIVNGVIYTDADFKTVKDLNNYLKIGTQVQMTIFDY